MYSECTDTIFTSFYELYLNTCLCVLEDWNPITALLKTSLKGLECRDAASLLQNKLYFWGRRKTLAAVQNNKQYIFYNGSTKIVCDITFLGLLVLLFCFKITREEKAWLPLSAFHSMLSSYFFFFLFVLCSLASALSTSTSHSGFPRIFYLFRLFKCLSSPRVKGEKLDSLRVMHCFCMAFQ